MLIFREIDRLTLKKKISQFRKKQKYSFYSEVNYSIIRFYQKYNRKEDIVLYLHIVAIPFDDRINYTPMLMLFGTMIQILNIDHPMY